MLFARLLGLCVCIGDVFLHKVVGCGGKTKCCFGTKTQDNHLANPDAAMTSGGSTLKQTQPFQIAGNTRNVRFAICP